MEPINSLAALYRILRRTVGTGAGSTSVSGKAARPQAPPAQRMTLEELEGEIRARLKGSTSQVLTSSASKRWVIASLLSWELDGRLRNEAKFQAMVRNVQRSIDGDDRLKVKFERIMERLSR